MTVDNSGTRTNGVNSGSRASNWNNYPWNSNWNIGLRAASWRGHAQWANSFNLVNQLGIAS